VRDHEPGEALFPPGDGLSVYRRLVPAAAALLRGNGALALEISPEISGELVSLLTEAGFLEPIVRPDLSGLPRVVFGRRPLSRPGARPAPGVE
jgi:release factor glutamine methyltransferase